MKRLLFIIFLNSLLVGFKADNVLFTGKIIYQCSFSDLNGNDLTESFATYFGREQHYYTDGKNYKMLDEKNNLIALYYNVNNTYYYFNKDGTIKKNDAAVNSARKVVITKMDKKESILGHPCKTIQIEADGTTTIYYYSSAVKVNSKKFSKHNLGEYNKYLRTTDGALPLKFIIMNYRDGYILTSVAVEIKREVLKSKDFIPPVDIQLKDH